MVGNLIDMEISFEGLYISTEQITMLLYGP